MYDDQPNPGERFLPTLASSLGVGKGLGRWGIVENGPLCHFLLSYEKDTLFCPKICIHLDGDLFTLKKKKKKKKKHYLLQLWFKG